MHRTHMYTHTYTHIKTQILSSHQILSYLNFSNFLLSCTYEAGTGESDKGLVINGKYVSREPRQQSGCSHMCLQHFLMPPKPTLSWRGTKHKNCVFIFTASMWQWVFTHQTRELSYIFLRFFSKGANWHKFNFDLFYISLLSDPNRPLLKQQGPRNRKLGWLLPESRPSVISHHLKW